MKLSSPLLAVLLAACAIPIFSAPIPIPSDDCVAGGSCRPSHRPQWQNKSRRQPITPLQEPHFPPHQLMPGENTDDVEVRILHSFLKDPVAATQPEPPIRNPRLDAVLKAARRDRAAAGKDMKWMIYQPTAAPTNGFPIMPPSHISKMNEADMEFVSKNMIKMSKFWWWSKSSAKCTMAGTPSELEDGAKVSGMTISYAYGFGYMRAAYTDVVVVSIVVLFLLVIVLVELFDQVIDTSRTFFHNREGTIRLQECDSCKSSRQHGLRTPEPSIIIPQLPRRPSIAVSTQLGSVAEKILVIESPTD